MDPETVRPVAAASGPATEPAHERAAAAATPIEIPQWAIKALCIALAAGMLFRELRLPGAQLDPSWMLATQYGLLHHIDFGRYLLISYGPLSVLTSGLFHPGTAWLTIAFQLICVLIVFWPAVTTRWSATLLTVLALCVLVDRIFYLNDGIVFAAAFSAFLLALLEKRAAALLCAAAIGILSLSKTSFFFAAAPLFLLADLHGIVRRRAWPLQVLVLLASLSVVFVVCGQPPSSLLLYLRNGYQISKGYSEAMSLPIGPLDLPGLLAFVGFALGLPLLLLLRTRAARQRETAARNPAVLTHVIIAIGLAWLTLVLYKASYARLDREHSSIGWNALLLMTPVALLASRCVLGGLAELRRTDLVWTVGACFAFLLTADLNRPGGVPASARIAAVPFEIVSAKVSNVTALLGWLSPAKWQAMEQQRVAILDRIAVRGLEVGQDSVDVYPFEVARVIAAGLNYQPRPALQSYLSYSPFMQALDREHWRSPNAPVHVLFQLDDIDGRLPTLALGPSIVEVLSRYDAVGPVGPAIHLQRRTTPRTVELQSTAAVDIALDEWITVPNIPGTLLLASIRLEPTLLAQLTAFLDRPPFLLIEIRTAGAVRRYRFIPAMATLGFAVSPDLGALFVDPAGFRDDLRDRLRGSTPVEAFRISGSRSAHRAYSRATVSFSAVQFGNPG